jgi:hypothetical protein
MSEIRRKLVIVGDGACGKVGVFLRVVVVHLEILTRTRTLSDLSLDRVFERHIPRGEVLVLAHPLLSRPYLQRSSNPFIAPPNLATCFETFVT